MSASAIVFSLLPADIAQFAPRLGSVSLHRRDGHIPTLDIKTPNFITSTSRGVVPHLSRDHVRSTNSIQWTNIPFESFLDRVPPVPTLQPGPEPLHTFLGYDRGRHILSISARDPLDGREIPTNGKDFISAYCIRGVRKVTTASWKTNIQACKPDVVVALSDIPFTSASQKRLTKSIERSSAWLAHLLSTPSSVPETSTFGDGIPEDASNVLVSLVGGTDKRARAAFSESLTEVLHGKEQQAIHPLRTLDEGVAGYQVELLSLRSILRAESPPSSDEAAVSLNELAELTDLIQASLNPLPSGKLRIVYGAVFPHEILRFVQDVGVDLFDVHWAQKAADIGVALDFRFPVPSEAILSLQQQHCPSPKSRAGGASDIGHNLFSLDYAHDHSRLASSFLDGASHSPDISTDDKTTLPVCACGACSPQPPSTFILHDSLTQPPAKPTSALPPYRRSYVHHLLHTHEMSSHTLLVMHNLSVMDAFFSGIRQILHRSHEEKDLELFDREVDRFVKTYAEPQTLFAEAEKEWARVESERGKGRLAREKEKQKQAEEGVQGKVVEVIAAE